MRTIPIGVRRLGRLGTRDAEAVLAAAERQVEDVEAAASNDTRAVAWVAQRRRRIKEISQALLGE